MMSDLLIKNLDEKFMQQLENNAVQKGVPVEEEVKSILYHALNSDKKDHVDKEDELLALADSIRQKNAHRQKTDCVTLIRESRNSR